jgi:hypothetical protein
MIFQIFNAMSNRPLFTKLEETENMFKIVFSWTSPDRHWEPKGRFWYVSYSIFFILLIAVNVILQNYIFIILIIAFAFMWFLQATVPPVIMEHSITSLGIRTYGKVFKWKSVKHFWFSNKNNVVYLNLEILDEYFTRSDRIQRLSIIIERENMEKLFDIIVNRIDYGDRDEVGYNFIDRLSIGKYIDISFFLYFEDDSQENEVATVSDK